jgi:protease-4
MSEDRVRSVTANGPFTADEAVSAGFANGTAFDDELERVTGELAGRPVSLQPYAEETPAPRRFGPASKIAVVIVEGDMVDGRSSHIPLVDMTLVGSYSVADTIKQVKDDPTIKSVVLRIESPGGSSLAADVMWRSIEELAKAKPLIVSMGSYAASGGYYIAAPGRTIYALPLTITGSIGVFFGKADVSGLLKKIGVNVDTDRTAPHADLESLFRPFTPEETKSLEVKVDQFYATFLDRVSQGRHMTKEQIDAVGRGRVWTGQQAWQRGLVDKMGGLRHALEEARAIAKLPEDAPIVEYPAVEVSLVDKARAAITLLSRAEADASVLQMLPEQVKSLARALAPMMVYRPEVPLERLEWVPLEE